MSNQGTGRVSNYIWDDTNKEWTRQEANVSNPTVSISGITPVDGKLPVDTEISVSGDIIVEQIKIKAAPLTETYPSGIYNQLLGSDDLVTVIQYNEPAARTTVSGIAYSSTALGTSALETFVSGVNALTITRTV